MTDLPKRKQIRLSEYNCSAPAPTNAVIPHAISTLKRFVNADLGQNIFQRSYYEHGIRGEADYRKMLSSLLVYLGVSEEQAVEDACKIEHDLSPESFAAIREASKRYLQQ